MYNIETSTELNTWKQFPLVQSQHHYYMMSYVCTHERTHTQHTHTHTHNTHVHTHNTHVHTHNTHVHTQHTRTHTWCSGDNSCSFRRHARDPRHISAAYLAHSTPPVLYKFPWYYKNNISLYTFPCDRDSCYMLLNRTVMLLSNHVAGAKCNIYVTFQVVVSPTMTHNTM